MNDNASKFLESIAPFAPLWKGVHISSLAVKLKNKCVSFVTLVRATLVDEQITTFYAEPTGRFFGLKAALPFPNLGAFLREFTATGRVRVILDNYLLEIYCDLAHAGLLDHPPPTAVGSVVFYAPTRRAPYDPRVGKLLSFLPGQISQVMGTAGDQLHQIISQAEIELISARLRSMKPAYSGMADFARRAIGVSYDPRISQSVWDIVAPLPFGMQPNDDGVVVQAPRTALPQVSVRAFCEGSAPHDVCLVDSEPEGQLVGKLDWPGSSDSAQAYLYYSGEEIGSVAVTRWRGTENWRVAADKYFDGEQRKLEAQLQARGESQEFEQGIVRLLALLGLPTIWYGGKHFHSRPDLAASFTIDGERFVLVGECVGQKPSTKFTPLLARLEELRTYLGVNSVTILPVVFTPCDVSPADIRDASHDGIIILGKSQLAELLVGAAQNWSVKQVLQYLESLLSVSTFPDSLL
ncbi:MAG TPA: hypothetical protein VMT05_08300 [Terriglobales bacterium]|nr:hypothetical protein [Terriglobales bacterium]